MHVVQKYVELQHTQQQQWTALIDWLKAIRRKKDSMKLRLGANLLLI
jgi:hypothetical protein